MPIQDVVVELNRLREKGVIVEYAIGGAVAAHVYVEVTSTEDIDVFVALAPADSSSLAPLSHIYAELIAHGARISGPYLEIGEWPVQFLANDEELYAEAVRSAVTLPLAGQMGRVMRPEYLAVIALQTGRAKDHIRLLQFLNMPADFDRKVFEALVSRFGLLPSWNTFQSKFGTGA